MSFSRGARYRAIRVVLAVLGAAAALGLTPLARAQETSVHAPVPPGKHFQRVLIVVLENQNYESAMKDKVFASLASKGVIFSNFRNLYHHSYPNYIAMVAGSDFGIHHRFNNDDQVDFPDDGEHKTIGDWLDWKNYAENYPASSAADKPYIEKGTGRFVRRHVPFLSFKEVQNKTFRNVVSVDTHDPRNAFVTDIGNFIADPKKYPLPQYMFYSPNMDDDGHDPSFFPATGLRKSSDWLSVFLSSWLRFDASSWTPKDRQMKGTLVIVTFDESEGNVKPERIFTVFLGDMVKPQEVKAPYDHYSVLRTIEDNFGLDPIHKDTGDGAASVITGIWK